MADTVILFITYKIIILIIPDKPKRTDNITGSITFDPAVYSNKVFGMYGGELSTVTLLFPKKLTGVMLDRFGKDVLLKRDSEEMYSVRTDVIISGHFFGWLAGLGKQVKIISPDSIRQQYKIYLSDILKDI